MLTRAEIIEVDEFGKQLEKRLEEVSKGKWGIPFVFGKPIKSEYWRAKIGKINRNWIQLNGSVYEDRRYESKDDIGTPRKWKIQARFQIGPLSNIWVKKAPYIYNRKPFFDFSIAADNVWAICYESMYKAIKDYGEEKLLDIILVDLRESWRNLSSTNRKTGMGIRLEYPNRAPSAIAGGEKLAKDIQQSISSVEIGSFDDEMGSLRGRSWSL